MLKLSGRAWCNRNVGKLVFPYSDATHKLAKRIINWHKSNLSHEQQA